MRKQLLDRAEKAVEIGKKAGAADPRARGAGNPVGGPIYTKNCSSCCWKNMTTTPKAV